MREWTLVVPQKASLISSNQRLHWAVRMRLVKDLRLLGMALASQRRIPAIGRAVVTVIVHPGYRVRRLDPSNYADTFKALMDGIVDAGVLRDDSAEYLLKVSYVEGVRWPRTGVELRISER